MAMARVLSSLHIGVFKQRRSRQGLGVSAAQYAGRRQALQRHGCHKQDKHQETPLRKHAQSVGAHPLVGDQWDIDGGTSTG
jgi:hypothetical protein